MDHSNSPVRSINLTSGQSPVRPASSQSFNQQSSTTINCSSTVMSDNLSDNLSLTGPESFTPEKYQRLATEYAKLRAKFMVLKNAVVEEKSRSTELKSELNTRDQNARRLQQEMESLQFRNQQLTKRVSVLQTDYEQATTNRRSNLVALFSGNSPTSNNLLHGNSSNSSSGGRDRSSSQSSVGSGFPVDPVLFGEINLELKNKIEENERLQELNHELENCRLQHAERLEHQIKKLMTDSEDREKTLMGEMRTMASSLNSARTEKVNFEKKLKQTLSELRDIRNNLNDLKFENANLKGRIAQYEQMINHSPTTRISNRNHSPLSFNSHSSSHEQPIKTSSSSSSSSPSSHQPQLTKSQQSSTHHPHDSIDINFSYSSRSYQDIGLREAVLEEFCSKLIELTSALSTLHSNVSTKVAILIRLFCAADNGTDDSGQNTIVTNCHFYFLDLSMGSTIGDRAVTNPNGVSAPVNSSQPPQSQQHQTSSSAKSSLSKYRSMPVLAMLQDFNEYLTTRYQGQLKSIEKTLADYCDHKLRHYKLTEKLKKTTAAQEATLEQSTAAPTNPEIEASELRIQEIVQKLGQLFASYLDYLCQADPHLRSCIAAWSRSLRVYDPKSPLSRELLDRELQSKLADPMNRENLCEKNLMLANSIAAGIEAIGQVYDRVQLFLSASINREESLEAFNCLMKRISLLHKILEDTIGIYSSKVVFEHDMSITIESELKEIDDSILSSFVLVGKCVQEVRKFFEVHYFFFVGQSHASSLPSDGGQKLSQLAESDEADSDSDTSVGGGGSGGGGGYGGQKRQQLNRFGPTTKPTTKCSVIDEDDEQQAKLIEDLETKLLQSQAKLSAIEREKEHWSIESQLSLVKLEREQKKSTELESQIQSLSSQLKQLSLHKEGPNSVQLNRVNSNNSASIAAGSVSLGGHSLDNNNMAELGSISSSSQSQLSPVENRFVSYPCEMPANEELFMFGSSNGTPMDPIDQAPTVEHLREKIRTLVDNLQVSDGRAATYQQECLALRQRLTKLQEQKELVDLRIVVLESELAEAREECQTSVLNYETQLSTMSDHLANLNDQLARQRDEIELLHYQQQLELAQPTSISTTGTSSGGSDKSNSSAAATTQSSLTKTLRKSFRKNKN